MHRSGTSAITRVLNLLGCALPEALVGPSEGNHLGHWEAASVVTLNDEILASAGSSWEDWGVLNPDWHQSGMRAQMLERVAKVVEEHASLGPLFAIKDPRLCRLADLWLEGMQAAAVDPKVILMIRHPAEVAKSLEARDLMAPGYAQLLWLRHVLDAEAATRGAKRVICSYDHLLNDWHGTLGQVRSQLGIALPRNSAAVHMEIDEFLDRGERHHNAADSSNSKSNVGSTWLRATYDALARWMVEGENEDDYRELDRIRREFDNSYSAFSRLLLKTENSGQLASGSQLKRDLHEKISAFDEKQALLDEVQAQLEQSRAQIAELSAVEAEVETLRQQLEEKRKHEEHLTEQVAQIGSLSQQLEEARKHEVELENKAAALEAAHGDARARIDEVQVEVALYKERESELIGEVDRLRSTVTTVQQQLADEQTERGDLEEQAAQRESELKDQLEAAKTDLTALKKELALSQSRLAAAEDDLVTTTKIAAERESRNEDLAGRLSIAESSLVQRQEELAQVWNDLAKVQREAGAAEAKSQSDQARLAELKGDLARATAALNEATSQTGKLEIRASMADLSLEHAKKDHDRLTRELAQATSLLRDKEDELADALNGLSERERRLGQMERANAELEEAASSTNKMVDEIAHLTRLLHENEARAAKSEASQNDAAIKLEQKTREIAQLTEMLAEVSASTQLTEQNSAPDNSSLEWLRELRALEQRAPKWWSLMPERWREKRMQRLYERAGLFDSEQYLEANPDVASSGMDPVRHYVLHGMDEGRALVR